MDIAKSLAVQLGAYALCFAAVRKWPVYNKGTLIERPLLKHKLDGADGVFCQPFFTFIAFVALRATYELLLS